MEMNMPMMNSSDLYVDSNDPLYLKLIRVFYPGIYKPTDDEVTACQAANSPWADAISYAWWTTYFIVAAFVVITVCNAIKRLHALNRFVRINSVIGFSPQLSAFTRMLSYPQSGWLFGMIPSAGPSILLFGFLIFSTLACFVPRPYYRPPNFGSPPLSLRSEWIATAMVPWLYAFATRRNFVTYFTGVSLKGVMVMHKYAPWICLYMSLVHTGAMIIQAKMKGPWSYTWSTDEFYRNGFIPLVALAWLCVMSIGPLRSRFYETFYFFHIIAAITFIVGMYIHLADLLNSWQYMHAAVVLWGVAILWRVMVILVNHGWILKGFAQASIHFLPGDMLRVSILVPASLQWRPGSHVYIRFLSVYPWQSHPFTIASLPSDIQRSSAREDSEAAMNAKLPSSSEKPIDLDMQKNEIVLLIKPLSGMTKRLLSLTQKAETGGAQLACILDGPYSGVSDEVRACDVVIMIAGGSGMSGLVPLALSLQGRSKLEMHWAVRNRVAPDSWFDKGWMEGADVNIYVTGKEEKENSYPGDSVNVCENAQSSETPVKSTNEQDIGVTISAPASGTEKDRKSSVAVIHHGRPDVRLIVTSCVNKCHGRVGVVVCGPRSMSLEVRNAVANAQKLILKGKTLCKELELYEESFSA
ncbi:uncharacterized protein MELLADRAFT_78600 [Melampsora larici-populina 98AG31]|uniref:FAD-binding FR-type domain-containing protein n=1 Tax=Melampsora larici-populina (strain 98AG31 / pathotype 3-4-7) TaxID=747676 RepID=F4RWF6_MELLP|nr:uncharacterized protein MELLADRAFT_78600 [Melampsora larici-populina 98AG31]EGG03330.1 hypothetical protein MELLADRAFT_78600 [Melampsora larici-populina 98AG31]